jgi:N-methylhydantoinase A/oxoprolinase/acetone carboxylase beta subunit
MGTTVATNALLERKGDRVLSSSPRFPRCVAHRVSGAPRYFRQGNRPARQLYERVIEVTSVFGQTAQSNASRPAAVAANRGSKA